MALDEAFAGVDETNIESMFSLVEQLDMDYIMNSQALWGCYPSVKALNIAELWRPQGARWSLFSDITGMAALRSWRNYERRKTVPLFYRKPRLAAAA